MMKLATYLLAAIGLLFLGGLANEVFFQSHTVDFGNRVEWASRIQNGPEVPVVLEHANIHHPPMEGSWVQLAIRSVFVFLPLGVLGLLGVRAFFALKSLLHGRNAGGHVDEHVVQDLFQVSKKLDARMEALETILLERNRRT